MKNRSSCSFPKTGLEDLSFNLKAATSIDLGKYFSFVAFDKIKDPMKER